MPTHKLNESFVKGYPAEGKEIQLHDRAVKGLTVRIFPSGNKSFNFRYTLNGRDRIKSIGRVGSLSLKDARNIVREWNVKVIRGEDPQDNSKDITFKELTEKFKKNKFPEYAKSTKGSYSLGMRRFSKLNNIQVSKIKRRDVTAIIDKKATESKGAANIMIKAFSVVMNWGVGRGLAERNVIAGLKKFNTGGSRTRFYSEGELQLLWEQFGEMNNPIGEAYKILLLTGQRKNEILKMRWVNVNFDGRYFIIPSSRTKNNNEHQVPLSDSALQILRELREQHPKSKFVFPTPWTNDDQPLEDIREAKEVIQENFISDFRPHDLRRTVATYCAKLGVPQHIVGRILNHKQASGQNTVTAIYNRYNYLDEMRTALQEWNGRLMVMVQGG